MTGLSIVLASSSPRRREILAWMGIPFSVTSADVDEMPLHGEKPAQYVMRLAIEKARASERQAAFGGIIVAADTTVADGDEIIGKPADADDALRILRKLRKRSHMVHTGIVAGVPSRGVAGDELCSTEVKMRAYTEEEMQTYVQSGAPMDKAGAYAIQDKQFDPVRDISGCFANVMGLPLCHLERLLRRLGYGVRKGVPYRCMRELSYTCPVFKRILAGEDVG